MYVFTQLYILLYIVCTQGDSFNSFSRSNVYEFEKKTCLRGYYIIFFFKNEM